MNNTILTYKKSFRNLLFPFLIASTFWLFIIKEVRYFLFIFVCFFLLIQLIVRPEFSLAVIFNGIFIYFYLIYKIGFETSSVMTGLFYIILTCAYLIGGVIITAKKWKGVKICSIDFFIFSNYFI